MNFKLGDFVRFVDENLEGHITRIIDKDTIGVTDSNDFEIPVLASKVTLVHGDMPGSEQETEKPTANTPSERFVRHGIYIGIVADQHVGSVAHFHIINDTSFQLLFSLTTEKAGTFKGEFANFISPHSAKKIYSASMGDIQVWPKFRLEILFYSPFNVEPKDPVILQKAIKGKDLSVAKQEIGLLNQKGWLIRIDEPERTINAEELKNSIFCGK
jgi:hypothetical protein